MAARPALSTFTRSIGIRAAWRSSSLPTTTLSASSNRRHFQSAAARWSSASSSVPDFAFAFDIDGVLLRSSDPIPRAADALRYLQAQRVPFILLTNGGGRSEADRVAEISDKLQVPLDVSMFVQSHTPFAQLDEYKDGTVLVVGGDGGNCRTVAQGYGFKNVVLPGDIYAANPEVWPFSSNFMQYYKSFTEPLPRPIDPDHPSQSLTIDAIFVYNDPRDWGMDAALIVDLLLSSKGVLGTLSSKNRDDSLPNRGFQQDGQPPLFFSNPDLWWAARFALPRLGQGGFREALEGLWAAITGGPRMGVELRKNVFGKPFAPTYEFAEQRLIEHRDHLFGPAAKQTPLRKVYMVGDNPESDIRGGNTYRSKTGSEWKTALVRTGVFDGKSEPEWTPDTIVSDVFDAVDWGVKDSGWSLGT